jgi:hypothetical protein
MMIYRQQRRVTDTRSLLRQIEHQILNLQRTVGPDYDALVHVLIDAGEFASAVADEFARDGDGMHPVSTSALEVALALARATEAGWYGDVAACHSALDAAATRVSGCAATDLPSLIRLSVSEGFAYYALGPELYAEAAHRWAAEQAPSAVWCIGLRTIGLTLAAVASAALQRRGIDAHTVSVRPRGHPFDRRPTLDAHLARALASSANAWWLVIDEGPGLSGSSMAGVARYLLEGGVPAERVVMMPAYQPDPTRFSGSTRPIWERLRVHAANYDATWTRHDRLPSVLNADWLDDIAGGTWRNRKPLNGAMPAVNPQHERRKYIAHRRDERAFVKFCGYGRYGERIRQRAAEAAGEGWSPAVRHIRHGWLEYEWLDEPFGVGDVAEEDLARVADYVAFVARTRRVTSAHDAAEFAHMAVHNAREFGGDDAARAMESIARHEPEHPVLADGHMRPHEWARRRTGLCKADGTEHGDDHFFPGPCDIAWDLAGAIDEWGLTDDAAGHLVRRYAAVSGDRTIGARLPFYRAAYLAFRAAATAFGRDQLPATDDGLLFAREHACYRQRLSAVLACAS